MAAGFRAPIGGWLGGAGTTGASPGGPTGPRSLLAFWLGGAAIDTGRSPGGPAPSGTLILPSPRAAALDAAHRARGGVRLLGAGRAVFDPAGAFEHRAAGAVPAWRVGGESTCVFDNVARRLATRAAIKRLLLRL